MTPGLLAALAPSSIEQVTLILVVLVVLGGPKEHEVGRGADDAATDACMVRRSGAGAVQSRPVVESAGAALPLEPPSCQ